MDKTRKLLSTSSIRKVTAPSLPIMIVHREALVQCLNEAIVGNISSPSTGAPHYRLILLEAPAGYGKTTLLTEFVQQSPITCCWYFLDRSDTEPLVFLRGLLASLQQGFPSFGSQLITLLDEAVELVDSNFPLRFLETLVETLTQEISQRFVLLLCNYQEVNAHAEITPLVEYLLSHLPEQDVIVLEIREIPELDFVSLLAGRAIIGLGHEFLRFTPQEICTLAQVQKRQELSITEAEQLANTFDGWITGLLLGTQLGDVQFLRRNRGVPLSREQQKVQIHTRALTSYVVNEVFKYHQRVYAFLREAVVVQKMLPSFCSELLGITESEARRCLQYLEQHGLFVTHSSEGEQTVYSCSPVLRALLYEELRQQSPERFKQLHRLAAELLSTTCYYEQAIYHALEASLNDLAIQLIIASAAQMLDQGHLETLQQWIATFSEAELMRYPRLLLIQAEVFLQKSELCQALPLLEKLTGLLNSPMQGLSTFQELPLLQAELAIVRARALSQQGQYQQAQDLCQRVLTYLPPDEATLHARAHICFGHCAQSPGDLTTKITHYQKSLQLLGRHAVNYLTANGHSSLAATYGMLGHFALAEHHSARATVCWEQLQNIQGRVNHLIVQANIKWDQDHFDEAERLLQQALALASSNPTHLRRWQAYTLVNLGDFYQDQGHSERSLAPAEEGLALARQLGDNYLLNYALITLTRTYLSMGDAITANLLLSEMRIEKTANVSSSSYQQARRNLLQGTILLYQHRYAEAHSLLAAAEAALNTMEIKREWLKALVRLAACYLGQEQLSKAFEHLATLEQILTTANAYRRLVCNEVRRLPYLQRAIEQRPEGAFLRTLLHCQSSTQELTLQETKGEFPLSEAPSPLLMHTEPLGSSRLRFLALGEPTVLLDERPITNWRMPRAMELCFYLLECGLSGRKEQILTALWGTADDHVSQTFYSTVHYLRKALGDELAILCKGGIYSLDLPQRYSEGGVWYDVVAFEEQYKLGKYVLAEGADKEAKAAFEIAVKLYRGDYVQPFYSDWCILRRDELQRLYLDTRRQLAKLAWNSENVEESILHWQQMLTIDANVEEAHYGLMRCYMRQGKHGLALRQYQRYSEQLQQAWGAVPGAFIQNLYQRLMGFSKAEKELF